MYLLIIMYLKYMYVMLTNVLALLICRIEISSESRLKKLRDGADETVVTGKKFTQKLKRQWVASAKCFFVVPKNKKSLSFTTCKSPFFLGNLRTAHCSKKSIFLKDSGQTTRGCRPNVNCKLQTANVTGRPCMVSWWVFAVNHKKTWC